MTNQLCAQGRKKKRNSLLTVAVVPLHQHNLLGDLAPLLHCAESEQRPSTRVRLLIPVRDTHASANRHVEAGQFTLLVCDSDETNIVRKDIHVVLGRDGHGDLEL